MPFLIIIGSPLLFWTFTTSAWNVAVQTKYQNNCTHNSLANVSINVEIDFEPTAKTSPGCWQICRNRSNSTSTPNDSKYVNISCITPQYTISKILRILSNKKKINYESIGRRQKRYGGKYGKIFIYFFIYIFIFKN